MMTRNALMAAKRTEAARREDVRIAAVGEQPQQEIIAEPPLRFPAPNVVEKIPVLAALAAFAALTAACGSTPHRAAHSSPSKPAMTNAAITRVCSDVNNWMDAVSNPFEITVPSRVVGDGLTYHADPLGDAVHVLASIFLVSDVVA
jgi:hypothetical protein